MTDAARISQPQLLPLPRWARLALALRCVRRARRLVGAPATQARPIDEALAALDRAVRGGAAGDELADAAAAAYSLALDNLDTQSPPSGSEVEEENVVVTCMVAHAAAFAAEAATLPDARAATQLVGQAVDFAVHAYRLAARAATVEAVAAMRADLDELTRAAAERGWTDASPVPAEFLGV